MIKYLFSDQECEKNEISSCFATVNQSNGHSIGIGKCVPKYKINMPNNFYVRN